LHKIYLTNFYFNFQLCLEDLNLLIKKLPQIARTTSIPNFNAITQFFLSKSIQEDGTLAIESNYENKSAIIDTSKGMLDNMEIIEEKLNEVMYAVGIKGLDLQKIDIHQESDVIKRTYSEMYVYQ